MISILGWRKALICSFPQISVSLINSEMDLDDEPPPLPPRNYNWSDVEDDDDDLFQSEDELEEPSVRISLADQQAMYSSVSILLHSFYSLLPSVVSLAPSPSPSPSLSPPSPSPSLSLSLSLSLSPHSCVSTKSVPTARLVLMNSMP